MGESKNDRPGCFGLITQFFQRLFSPASKEQAPLPYRLRDDFLSPAELSYYRVLTSVLGAKAAVCAKVRLADLLFVADRKEYQKQFNKIVGKHVDFLICEASTMSPVLAIELDDASHSRKRRQERDRFLDESFVAAGFPLMHVRAQRQYDKQQVIDQLKPYLLKSSAHKPPQESPGSAPLSQPAESSASPSPVGNPMDEGQKAPICPKCGIPMVMRVAAKGKFKGRRFYGCVNFPQCREVLPA